MDKQNWPEFPLSWLEQPKRNMAGLQEIASHLHGKTAAGRSSRSGFAGNTSEMEKQIIRNLTDLEQQVYVLTDVVQAALQIIAEYHYRRSHKARRALAWIRETASKYGNRVWNNTIFKVFGALSTLAFIIGLLAYLLHAFRK